MNRRSFLAAGGLTLLGCSRKTDIPLPPGDTLGPNYALGHRFRDGGGFPAASETRRTGVLIVGGGMAGLSCAWWLKRGGMDDFTLLELDAEAGGNARSGRNSVSAYPWGAHYVPLPGVHARELRIMLADFGVLRGDPSAAKPEYDERYLCFAPQERLFRKGTWQEGLLPQYGISRNEHAQQQQLLAAVAQLKASRDANHLPTFNIPSVRSAAIDPALDTLSIRDWMLREGYTAPSLHWWMNYCCRDDYGTDYAQVSAWAGLHYHASRHGEAANADSDSVLTWPEGNGWLAHKLIAYVGAQLRTGAMVWRIEETPHGMTADVFLPAENRSVRYQADRIVWAGPSAWLHRVWDGVPPALRAATVRMEYAPWLVANLTLRDLPAATSGMALCWDNVLQEAAGLGYVVATHQRLDTQRRDTVLTYYRPLSEYAPTVGRKVLLDTPREVWASRILNELSQAHPDIAGLTTRLDVWRWGHAMTRPTVGMLDGHLNVLRQPTARLILAHADLSGFSLAEEAHYWGVRAARWAMGDKEWKEA